MHKRLITRYTVKVTYETGGAEHIFWGTCQEWLAEFGWVRYTAHKFDVKTERVLWFGDSPLCNALHHKH